MNGNGLSEWKDIGLKKEEPEGDITTDLDIDNSEEQINFLPAFHNTPFGSDSNIYLVPDNTYANTALSHTVPVVIANVPGSTGASNAYSQEQSTVTSAFTNGKPKTRKKIRKYHKCEFCSYQSLRKCNIGRHIDLLHSHESMNHFPCSLCSFTGSFRHHLENHMKEQHPKEKPFTCPLCEYCTVTKKHLKNHLISKHIEDSPHKCSFCGHSARCMSDLTKHMMANHTQ